MTSTWPNEDAEGMARRALRDRLRDLNRLRKERRLFGDTGIDFEREYLAFLRRTVRNLAHTLRALRRDYRRGRMR